MGRDAGVGGPTFRRNQESKVWSSSEGRSSGGGRGRGDGQGGCEALVLSRSRKVFV